MQHFRFQTSLTIKMLKGVVGLVTGGASGLGKATVERIVRQGGKVSQQPHRNIVIIAKLRT